MARNDDVTGEYVESGNRQFLYMSWLQGVDLRLAKDGRKLEEFNDFPWWDYFESCYASNVAAEIAMGCPEED